MTRVPEETPDQPLPALSERSRKIMQALRRVTYQRDDVLERPIDKPYLFHAPHLCGSYAIFIFGSYRCDKYVQGLCTPCHYSGLLHPAKLPRAEVHGAVLDQVDYMLEHFEDLVMAHQLGTGAGYRLLRPYPGGRFADIQVAGEGSWLRDGEIPPAIRVESLDRLDAFAKRQSLNLHVGLEVKAEDILRAEERGELDTYASRGWIDRLNLSLIMGFESTDPLVRNVIFNKRLSLDALERAIEVGHRRGMRPTCFVYTGNHAMTDAEVIADAVASIRWLRERGAGIYLMMPNLQPHTIPHLLYQHGHHDLIDIRTAIPILDELLAHGAGDDPIHFHAGQDWNIGGVTSEPDPELNIFTNPHSASCKACVGRFRKGLLGLAHTHDIASYRAHISVIEACACREAYADRVLADRQRGALPLGERVATDLHHCERLLPQYEPRRTVLHTGPLLEV